MKMSGFFFLILYNFLAHAEVFKIGLPVIVPFNPISNEVNSNVYIGLQLYYPLFNLDENGSLSSKFLDIGNSRALDHSFEKYQMCLLPGKKFSDGSPITQKDFISSLSAMGKLYPHLIQIQDIKGQGSDCVYLQLKQKTPFLFKRLTGIASTILKSTDVEKTFPVGYGPYRIEKQEKDSLFLKYNEEDSLPRFNQIEFRKVSHEADLKQEAFQDLNQTTSTVKDKLQGSLSKSITFPSLKVYTLVINYQSKAQRACIAKTLNAGNWNEAFQLKAMPQKNFLPWKEETKDINFEKIKCGNLKIDFIMADAYDSNKVENEIKKLKSSLQINLKLLPTSDFINWVFSGKPYVAMISFDSSSAISSLDGNFTDYFESFFTDKNRIVSKAPNGLSELITKSNRFSTTGNERLAVTKQAEALLLENFYVLPIGRMKRKLAFPKDIEIKEWADTINGFPSVWKIE